MGLDYLCYYTELSEPGYAVLVVGPWGIGKTYQVKELLAEQEPIFVSLFGEPTVAAVHEAVLAASVSPAKSLAKRGVDAAKWTAETAANQLGGPFSEVLKAVGGASASFAMRLLRDTIDPRRVIVFDDLERSTIPTKELLGLMNEYVEHHGCRVVVIANEEKLLDEVGPMREKLFGQTLAVQPNLDAAFATFFEANDTDRHLSGSLQRIVRDVFDQSGIESLRVARQLIHDVVRLLGQLPETQRGDTEALEKAVGCFAAWAVEVRARRLERYHVDRESSAAIGRALVRLEREDQDPEESDWRVLQEADRRYRSLGIALIDNAWPGALLECMLFDGDFRAKDIKDALDQTPWFESANALSAWRVLWWWQKFSGEELVDAAARLERQFNSRDPVDTSCELLHMCTRLLHAVNWQLLEMATDEALDLCRAYIDVVVPNLSQLDVDYDNHNSSGLGFCESDSPVYAKYCDVREYLRDKIEVTYQEHLPALATKLQTSLSTGGADAFLALLNRPPRSANRKLLPYLHELAPEAFVEQLLSRPAQEHYVVIDALAKHREELDRERNEIAALDVLWMERIAEVLARTASDGSMVAPFRLRILANKLAVDGT